MCSVVKVTRLRSTRDARCVQSIVCLCTGEAVSSRLLIHTFWHCLNIKLLSRHHLDLASSAALTLIFCSASHVFSCGVRPYVSVLVNCTRMRVPCCWSCMVLVCVCRCTRVCVCFVWSHVVSCSVCVCVFVLYYPFVFGFAFVSLSSVFLRLWNGRRFIYLFIFMNVRISLICFICPCTHWIRWISTAHLSCCM